MFFINYRNLIQPILLLVCLNLAGQSKTGMEAKQGNYKNPIIFGDYSDPDAIRVGDDYYMVSSSFSHFPGLPVLHSKDLVNWTIIGHALQNYPFAQYDKPQHGNAVWAPSIRYHEGTFYIFYGDPDNGVFMTKSIKPEGPWEPLKQVRKVTGWIDCCPFWDEDGNAYLVHAFANSRCGIKSILAVNKMNPDCSKILDDGVLVFNGQKDHPTMEGPKMYKRTGYYYIFAPSGGVSTGWQTILRSKNVFGPYEDKIVLEQGSTKINGPHQGAWLDTPKGEDWFIHFQDKGAYGRVVLLQPMQWINDWPVMGVDVDKNGIGEPVEEYKTPIANTTQDYPIQTSDEFTAKELGLQWQWQSNYKNDWYSIANGQLKLFPQPINSENKNLWLNGNLLMQKFPAQDFTATTKLKLDAKSLGEKAGLVVFGRDYAYISIEKTKSGYKISQVNCIDAVKNPEVEIAFAQTKEIEVYFKVDVMGKQMDNETTPFCTFSYSFDNKVFTNLGSVFKAREGVWVGAKLGVFATKSKAGITSGNAYFDWFLINN